ncbi:FecR domain-containing protein [Runella sp.]|jgi:ferric-dicitrate binding protein FerR (iron transport regulator)|uniref:FecR family protein n=1 Tax=Runella sp. TaxID=1960881 RepID=UPI00261C8777|nr:FecR domain-containing protein [Runella sp.]
MISNTHIPDDLLARYVAGETTEDETRQVKEWLDQSANHEQELVRFQRVWETYIALKPQAGVDVDAAWKKVSKRVHSPQSAADSVPLYHSKSSHKSQITIHTSFNWRAAASVLMILGLGWLGYRFLQPIEKQELASVIKTQKNTLEQMLPDGTKVFLNQNSTLTSAADFNDETRTVTLTGEAYFDVKRDETRPFIIKANGTEVRVLGTSFNVKAYGKRVSVAVTSGKVQFSTPKAKTLLVKNESAAVQADTIMKLPELNFNELAYRTRVFVFDKTNLGDVVASLRDGYHADIQLSSRHLANCRLTARFERESLDATLTVIAETLNLKVVRRGNSILLDGSGCE